MSRILSAIVLLTLRAAFASADDAPFPSADFAAKFAAPELEFDSKPAWMKSLDRSSKNGLPFVRIKRNIHSDLVFGVRGDGYLSIYLIARSDR